jgi:hypothetical protein
MLINMFQSWSRTGIQYILQWNSGSGLSTFFEHLYGEKSYETKYNLSLHTSACNIGLNTLTFYFFTTFYFNETVPVMI